MLESLVSAVAVIAVVSAGMIGLLIFFTALVLELQDGAIDEPEPTSLRSQFPGGDAMAETQPSRDLRREADRRLR